MKRKPRQDTTTDMNPTAAYAWGRRNGLASEPHKQPFCYPDLMEAYDLGYARGRDEHLVAEAGMANRIADLILGAHLGILPLQSAAKRPN